MGIPVVCDGYVKYEEADFDRLAAILKTNSCSGIAVWNTVSSTLSDGCLTCVNYIHNRHLFIPKNYKDICSANVG